jgi:hypothetical protein
VVDCATLLDLQVTVGNHLDRKCIQALASAFPSMEVLELRRAWFSKGAFADLGAHTFRSLRSLTFHAVEVGESRALVSVLLG